VRLAPPEISLTVFNGIGELPLFNPDLVSQLPTQVVSLHEAVAAADALLIASPEYAHGVTGAIKNTLDWLVGFEQFAYKPVAVLNISQRAYIADAALRETLKTMAAVIIEPTSIDVPLLGENLNEEGMIASPTISTAIRTALVSLLSSLSVVKDFSGT
jgi:NAD(P)H-dependent FMN reductase